MAATRCRALRIPVKSITLLDFPAGPTAYTGTNSCSGHKTAKSAPYNKTGMSLVKPAKIVYDTVTQSFGPPPGKEHTMHTVFRFLRQLLLTVLLLALLTLVAAGGYFAVTGHKLYESAIQVTPIDTLYSSISSREGFVPYAQLPQTYINAVISAEDSRFTHHKGVDPVSIARALVTDLRTGSFAEGGSTITQQLAKNTLFTQEKHLARKAAEMFAALAIEKQYNKEQIFEMYVNTIYFGSGHYGIGEAAQGYFGKTPLQLTDAEAVMLAGLPNAPSAYSPNSSPDLAVKRMQVVLNRMVGCKKLTREQADALAAEAVTLQFLPAS